MMLMIENCIMQENLAISGCPEQQSRLPGKAVDAITEAIDFATGWDRGRKDYPSGKGVSQARLAEGLHGNRAIDGR
jgi:hypothetical protein